MLRKNTGTGANSYVYLSMSGRYYALQVTVNRRGTPDRPTADHEADAAQTMAKMLLPQL